MNKAVKPSRYIMDLDGTITVQDRSVGYEDKPLNKDIAAAMSAALKQGYEVDVLTARGMDSRAGDLTRIEAEVRPIGEAWLKKHKVSHGKLTMGKPWCGPDGFYVDDRNLHLEEFIFRTTGPFADKTVDVVIPFYNEEPNIEHAHGQQKRLERLLNIGHYIYVNNGSRDGTGAKLEALAEHDPRVKVVNVQVNKGYGFGMKSGIKAATADYVLTNHADGQFDAYTFLLTHMLPLGNAGREGAFTVLPRRLNRPLNWAVRTLILRILSAILVGRKLGEFNGQPKIWQRDILSNPDTLPDDFCLDLALYLRLTRARNPICNLPILEKPRYKGFSSWAGQARRTWRLSFRYLEFAWSMRGN